MLLEEVARKALRAWREKTEMRRVQKNRQPKDKKEEQKIIYDSWIKDNVIKSYFA